MRNQGGSNMSPIEREKLETLNGDRGDGSNAALRIKHARAILDSLPTEPTGNTANDIRALYAAFNRLSIALR